MTLKDWTDVAATLVQAGSVAATAYFASKGLQAWRTQLLGKRRIELAEEILGVTYLVQTNLRLVRSPFSFIGEGATRPRLWGEPDERTPQRDRYFATVERVRKVEGDLQRFAKARGLAWVYFGGAADGAFGDINGAYFDVLAAARTLIDLVNQPGPEGNLQQWQAIVWQTDQGDEIGTTVATAVSKIETLCRPLLEDANGSTWWQRVSKLRFWKRSPQPLQG